MLMQSATSLLTMTLVAARGEYLKIAP